jgi:hypothetical protein
MKPGILDVDTGIDDALAIAYARILISLIGIPVDFKLSIILKASISDFLNKRVPLVVRSTKGISPSLS